MLPCDSSHSDDPVNPRIFSGYTCTCLREDQLSQGPKKHPVVAVSSSSRSTSHYVHVLITDKRESPISGTHPISDILPHACKD